MFMLVLIVIYRNFKVTNLTLYMYIHLDFAAHFTIHAIKWAFKTTTFYLESVVLESRSSTNSLPNCQSERSLRYFHLDRISA